MPKVQAETYKNVVRNFREEKGSAFSVIAKLRDISLHPRLSTMRVESLSPEEANKIINESDDRSLTNAFYQADLLFL